MKHTMKNIYEFFEMLPEYDGKKFENLDAIDFNDVKKKYNDFIKQKPLEKFKIRLPILDDNPNIEDKDIIDWEDKDTVFPKIVVDYLRESLENFRHERVKIMPYLIDPETLDLIFVVIEDKKAHYHIRISKTK